MLVAVGLGSNLGDRRTHLTAAVTGLAGVGEVTAVSSLWSTAPVGGPPQGPFLNAVAVIDTVIGPRPLLETCFDLERSAGRVPGEKWGPRLLDLDLLLYGDAVIDAPGLRVPHPRMTERRFVLAPLAEVWPEAVVPGHGPVAGLLMAVAGQEAEVVAGPGWEG
ncbi:MAG: 2-amino-4-hydroxy-6-hydroxymethyldihydropteridine diphosphokinase [Actinomycetota bacterium]